MIKQNMSVDDPLLPWLRSIKESLDGNGANTKEIVSNCVRHFENDARYWSDPRFLKVLFLHMDLGDDFDVMFNEMQKKSMCKYNSMLYETYALILEAKGSLTDALMVYQSGISRNAKPLQRLKKARVLFLERMSEIVNACSGQKDDIAVCLENGETYINPWSESNIKDQLQKMEPQIKTYEGYYFSHKAYSGRVALSKLRTVPRNKIIEIGGKKYQIKGCAGQGGFAQVFKAFVDGDSSEVVALKIQKPPFPWEFYIYRQLDKRIPSKERRSFGYACWLHLYADYSILVSDYLGHGTLQDAINANVVLDRFMEEVLIVYYTIEMLLMLEILHSIGIIHGDFKPDNLLIRYARNNLVDDDLTEENFRKRSGPWLEQGLCLVDWGKGIDLHLLANEVKFVGDCRTSGFRCIEMQENKPWKYQVDIYGLCAIVHMMLHNTYMEIEKKACPDGGYIYLTKSSLKRYWQVELWRNLFTELLNIDLSKDHKEVLRSVRWSFEDYLFSSPHLFKKLNQSLTRQKISLCSS